MKDIIRRDTNLIFAFTQLLIPFLPQILKVGKNVGETMKQTPTPPEVPAPYAFGIWGIIFILSIVYAIYQALPAQKENPLLQKIGFYTATTFLSGTLWMLIAQLQGNGWILVGLIILMLLSSLKAFLTIANSENLSKFEQAILVPLWGLFSGWLSLATFLNITSVVKQNFVAISLSPSLYALFNLIPASLLVFIIILKTRHNLWYKLAVIWGLIGIIVSNITTVHNAFVIDFCSFMTFLVIISKLFKKNINI